MSVELDFPRAVCCNASLTENREWLVTNGLGGFASGTVRGVLARRYHGLLVAALQPPLERTLLVSHFDETARYAGGTYALFVNRWADGSVAPRGDLLLERFRLEDGVPVWTFALADALIEKSIWMEQHANLTWVRYTVVRAGSAVELELKALANYRDFHSTTHAGGWRMDVQPLDDGVRVVAFAGATAYCIRCAGATVSPANEWYYNYALARESERGLDANDDNLHVATFGLALAAGESATLSLATADVAPPQGDPLERFRSRRAACMRVWREAMPAVASGAPAWFERLVAAADQFVVRRATPPGASVIAGYHWFGEWGRDTMIALPGLTLATGRPEVARDVFREFAGFVDGGMLPNIPAGPGQQPQYNSVDASLWFIEAVRAYVAATADRALLAELYPVLRSIARAYTEGTRFGIHADADGLIVAGEPGVQLTWMDAKAGDDVITPRRGKPVEVAALWINALAALAAFAAPLGAGDDAAAFELALARARRGFERFWNAARGCLFDVIDGPEGDDGALRPNQIFAVALPGCTLAAERRRAVVDVCARELLTTYGLRSLSPGEPGYRGTYGGDPAQRDGAYHQGTVWCWLIGAFALAHARAYGNLPLAESYVAGLGRQLDGYGLGTLGELADGDAPHAPGGAIAQAWSVAEVLRAWSLLRVPT